MCVLVLIDVIKAHMSLGRNVMICKKKQNKNINGNVRSLTNATQNSINHMNKCDLKLN